MDPVSRSMLIRRLRRLGFEGPYVGAKHQFMVLGGRRLILPNPHMSDVGPALLARILREAHISTTEWETTGNCYAKSRLYGRLREHDRTFGCPGASPHPPLALRAGGRPLPEGEATQHQPARPAS